VQRHEPIRRHHSIHVASGVHCLTWLVAFPRMLTTGSSVCRHSIPYARTSRTASRRIGSQARGYSWYASSLTHLHANINPRTFKGGRWPELQDATARGKRGCLFMAASARHSVDVSSGPWPDSYVLSRYTHVRVSCSIRICQSDQRACKSDGPIPWTKSKRLSSTRAQTYSPASASSPSFFPCRRSLRSATCSVLFVAFLPSNMQEKSI